MRLMQASTLCATFALTACTVTVNDHVVIGNRPVVPASDNADPWYRAGESTLQAMLARNVSDAPARNVIIFIGDGMSLSTVTAARILEGQMRGEAGEENALSFEKMPWTGLSKTYSTNAQVPDSAATASAMLTGVKTKSEV